MQQISAIVKQSWTSTTSRSRGETPAIAYARSAASWVAFIEVKLDFSCRYGWSVATPKPATKTGFFVNRSAISALTSKTAAAPSVCGQQSRRCSGEQTAGEAITSSMVISFWKCAYGSIAPL